MEYKMRRSDRELSNVEAKRILKNCEYGVLSTIGDDGYPYGVPLSYVYDGEKMYFHASSEVGHKLHNINLCNKVSFTVIGKTKVIPDKFTTRYESAIAFGSIRLLDEELEGIEKLCKKYCPDYIKEGMKYARDAGGKLCIMEMQIERLTGKARR